MTDVQVGAEMPHYRSHKEVWALKIGAIEIHANDSATIAPEDDGYAPFKTRPGWASRFEKPTEDDLGYYVVYDDGFSSWSPTKAFESGYTRMR